MTYMDMIEELMNCGEITEDEKITLVDYNGWPVGEEMLILEIIGVAHSEDTATIIVVPSAD